MPEFILDLGDKPKEFHTLDEFTRGYIEAMFFTNSGDREDELNGVSFSDFATEALEAIRADCARFQTENETALQTACDHETVTYDLAGAGRDFWYNRNGHGVGFWDRGLGHVGDLLDKAAGQYREINPYVGDDGLIYF